MKKETEDLEKQEKQWKEKDDEIKKQERIRPLDVDDLTHEGKSKTSINKKVTEERPQNMTEEEQAEFYVNSTIKFDGDRIFFVFFFFKEKIR